MSDGRARTFKKEFVFDSARPSTWLTGRFVSLFVLSIVIAAILVSEHNWLGAGAMIVALVPAYLVARHFVRKTGL